MKTLYHTLGIVVMALSLTTFTGCIEETEPTTVATADQVAASTSATEALAAGLPAYFNYYMWNGDYHFDFGYGAMMMIRNVMDGDYGRNSSSYNHFSVWERNIYQDENYVYCQFIWNYYYGFVLTANTLISNVDPENATEDQLGYLGAGYAYRALLYLDLARMYEFLPNDATDAINSDQNNVLNLTVPIVDENTTEEEARNNPRATRDEMAAFIKSDLDNALQYIDLLPTTNGHTLPTKDAVYGLYARLYMWIEDYANAQKYARLAIDNSSTDPMTESECLSTTTGFNTADPWMWAAQLTSEDDVVQTGIINWSQACNEVTFGYCGTGTGLYDIIDRKMYERISDTDFRKLEWKAPEGSALEGQNTFLIPEQADYDESSSSYMPAYASLKFRPGNGNTDDYKTACAVAYPIMRIEEMYFIEAEAAAQQGNVSTAVSLLNDFMSNYRDSEYNYSGTAQNSVIDEIVFQKRVELWGEGQNFFDIKRLNMPTTRGYSGTNHYATSRLNTTTRPAWMNLCIVQTEANNNAALKGWNNPSPSGKYDIWTE